MNRAASPRRPVASPGANQNHRFAPTAFPPRRGTAGVLVLALALAGTSAGVAPAFGADADEQVVNLYSARHYQTDAALFENFTRETGIKVRLIEGKDAEMLERLKSEGERSPADVLMLVDAAHLWRAEQQGVFSPVDSAVLNARIPANLRAAAASDGTPWFGISTRARMLFVNPQIVDPALVKSYADLARPELKGKVCTRSGSHPYMLSLIAAMTSHLGVEKAQAWAQGVVDNLARTPRGGDTDQLKAVASGECGVAVANSYYYARLMNSDKADDKAVVAATRAIWPDQDGFGTHVNVSGAGVVKSAPHRAAAIRFLEYLASDAAQRFLADGNNEWPTVASVEIENPALTRLGSFKADQLPIAKVGAAQPEAARIIDRVGWR